MIRQKANCLHGKFDAAPAQKLNRITVFCPGFNKTRSGFSFCFLDCLEVALDFSFVHVDLMLTQCEFSECGSPNFFLWQRKFGTAVTLPALIFLSSLCDALVDVQKLRVLSLSFSHSLSLILSLSLSLSLFLSLFLSTVLKCPSFRDPGSGRPPILPRVPPRSEDAIVQDQEEVEPTRTSVKMNRTSLSSSHFSSPCSSFVSFDSTRSFSFDVTPSSSLLLLLLLWSLGDLPPPGVSTTIESPFSSDFTVGSFSRCWLSSHEKWERRNNSIRVGRRWWWWRW